VSFPEKWPLDFSIDNRHRSLQPFYRMGEYIYRTQRLTWLAKEGTLLVVRNADLTESLGAQPRASKVFKVTEQVVEEAQRARELADHELAAEFPLLHGHALVGLWGALEAWRDEVVSLWVRAYPESCELDDVVLKVDAAALLSADADSRVTLVSEALLTGAGPGALGVGFFELPFGRIGLGGGVSDELRRDMLLLQQVRHIWAHCSGRVDQAFLERCPWFDATLGEPVHVSHDRFHQLVSAASDYVCTVMDRACERHGIEDSEPSEQALQPDAPEVGAQ